MPNYFSIPAPNPSLENNFFLELGERQAAEIAAAKEKGIYKGQKKVLLN